MKLRRYEVVNQTEYMSLDSVKSGIANPAVKKWAYVLHDRDVNSDGSPKSPHYHVLLWLNNNYDSMFAVGLALKSNTFKNTQ